MVRLVRASRTFIYQCIVCWATVAEVAGKRPIERSTIYGTVRGYIDTLHREHTVEKYLGIPYASPPVGKLRFEAPEPPEPWQGVRDVNELSPACPQSRSGMDYIQFHVPEFNKTSEDCLYLNIFVPKKTARYQQRHSSDHNSNRGYAVIVFVHGGSYLYGMGAMMDGSYLTTHDVIVITFNYRLGALGFLEANDEVFPGNYGLLDQVAALRWVQQNINHFGGDPTRVTIDGHSAGGCSVGLLMMMPAAKGLFTRVIQQSGSPFAEWAVSRHPTSANLYYKLFTSGSGCYGNNTKEVKACLKNVSSEKIQAAIDDLIMHPVSMVPPFRPVVDGRVLPDTPERLAIYGEIHGQQILTGTTTDEGLEAAYILFNTVGKDHHGLQRLLAVISCFSVDLPDIRSLIEFVLEQYYQWPNHMDDTKIKEAFTEIVGDYFIAAPTHRSAELLASRNVTVYLYNFDYFSAFEPWEGAKHGAELFYLSGYPFSGHANFRYDETDKAMAALLLQTWANFAQNGLPTLLPKQDFRMPAYTPTNPSYTQITSTDNDVAMTAQRSYKQDKMSFWNSLVPKLYTDQITKDVYLINGTPSYELQQLNSRRSPNQRQNEDVRKSPVYTSSHTSGSWVLMAACVGLCTLTVLLSVCYCQVKRQVKTLIRQTSINSGEPIL